jgi:NADPH:quinone reductase-like Zn-dependent oxidoreductase
VSHAEAAARPLAALTAWPALVDRFDDELSGLDVVIDGVGGETLDRSYRVLRPGGRLVTLASPRSSRSSGTGRRARSCCSFSRRR